MSDIVCDDTQVESRRCVDRNVDGGIDRCIDGNVDGCVDTKHVTDMNKGTECEEIQVVLRVLCVDRVVDDDVDVYTCIPSTLLSVLCSRVIYFPWAHSI